jgi:hypothetical protein
VKVGSSDVIKHQDIYNQKLFLFPCDFQFISVVLNHQNIEFETLIEAYHEAVLIQVSVQYVIILQT